MAYCCTCAATLPTVLSEKLPARPDARALPCCGRSVCGRCLQTNPRFASYCPYCQIASDASPTQHLLPPGLRPPPPYRRRGGDSNRPPTDPDDAPPPYAHNASDAPSHPEATDQKEKASRSDTAPLLHYLDHDRDSVSSLALRYHVTTDAIRRANRLAADHLLLGRRVVAIPQDAPGSASSSAPAVSLSPTPVEGEAEARRKAQIRRFMVACKVADYDLAVLYLEQSGTLADSPSSYDLAAAIAAYQADVLWERQNPRAKRVGRC